MDKKYLVKIINNTVANNRVVYINEVLHVNEKDLNTLIKCGKAVSITEEEKAEMIRKELNKDITDNSTKNDEVIKKLVKRGK
jgi:hypothetical protein